MKKNKWTILAAVFIVAVVVFVILTRNRLYEERYVQI